MSLLLSKNTIAKIGEDMPLSEEFINVINLNTLCHNFPIFDIIATHKKDGQTYVFSAKARKKYGQNGKINPSYNILSGKNIALKYKKALDLLETFGYFDVHCCFLICPIQNGNNISYYYGKFTLINPKYTSYNILNNEIVFIAVSANSASLDKYAIFGTHEWSYINDKYNKE